ncbi:MAG TPA: c-type cytochrome [Gammaproteobacteria bacterium]|mgnify:CR=1 FL=1|nr:c-type cytochrome [Gammaproteobacteria bacterium]
MKTIASHFLFSLFLFLISGATQAGDLQQLLQLIDYVGADYHKAVTDNQVIDQGEYEEMLDFSAGIQKLVTALPNGDPSTNLQQQSATLSHRITGKVAPAEIRNLTAAMRQAVISGYDITVIPRRPPDLQRGATLYAEQCASCHGRSGDGAGPLAAGLDPPPVSFLDHERYLQRTLYGLFNTITQGVAGTGMRSYNKLSGEDRWALAFYVGQFAIGQTALAKGPGALTGNLALKPLLDLQTLTTTTPAEAVRDYGNAGGRLTAYLRTHPVIMFSQRSPLEFSQQRLNDVLAAYRDGDHQRAYELAVEAYLGGFELAEQGLNTVNPGLRITIEQAMTGLRTSIRAGVPIAELEADVVEIQQQLSLSREQIAGSNLSGGAAFTAAFFILLREGLEALLVVAALAAFLVKTKHRGNLRYLHYGWIGALLAGILTWWASVSLIKISGANREVTEGVAALLATAVLFYVGFWLNDKTNVMRWKQFIETNVTRAMSSGTLWGLAGLSFLAVYREVFETILFYQALWVQTDQAGKTMVTGGFLTAAAALVVLAWLVMRYSARLPLRQFFSVTGVLMFVLALIFAGKGVAALQEAGYIAVIQISFPRIELLGIYPNLYGLLLQLGLLLLALYLWFGLPTKRRFARD